LDQRRGFIIARCALITTHLSFLLTLSFASGPRRPFCFSFTMLPPVARSLLSLAAVCAVATAAALPRAGGSVNGSDAAPTPLSQDQIDAYTPYTYLAGAAYCEPTLTLNWTCGVDCDKVPGFVPFASGGTGNSVQYWYVGYWPEQNTTVVAHQGTHVADVLSIITDINYNPVAINGTLYPGLPHGIEVHDGFQQEHAKTAIDVLFAVYEHMTVYNTNHVTIVGHSLGAAIGLLDAVMLPIYLPNIEIKTVFYGLPRVGNSAFADYVDEKLPDLVHINHNKDPVPTVPGRGMGFAHPSNEIHITDDNVWNQCVGQDSIAEGCTIDTVPNVLEGNILNHLYWYNGIKIGGCNQNPLSL